MKLGALLLLSLLLAQPALAAKPLVLIGYFDSFNRAPFNNSGPVARALARQFSADSSPVQVKLCALETKFDTAYAQFERCLKNLREIPALVLGLGEGGCDLKVEIMGRNLDKTKGPDNAGEERDNTVIIPEAPSSLGFNYPLAQMYCSLSPRERSSTVISSSAGSFVCNNTAFQLSYYYPELTSGFMHVPSHKCRHLERKTGEAVQRIATMIMRAVEVLSSDSTQRLPTHKKEIEIYRHHWKEKDQCLYEFYKRTKGVDEKRFFGFFNN